MGNKLNSSVYYIIYGMFVVILVLSLVYSVVTNQQSECYIISADLNPARILGVTKQGSTPTIYYVNNDGNLQDQNLTITVECE